MTLAASAAAATIDRRRALDALSLPFLKSSTANPFKTDSTPKRRKCTSIVIIISALVLYTISGGPPTGHRTMAARQVNGIVDQIISSQQSLEPLKGSVKNIFWLHIQKCGTSLFNTLYLHFCPKILELNPQLAARRDKALIEYDLIKQFPSKKWCPPDVNFYNMPRVGFHWPYETRDEQFTSFAMLRNPLERLKSAYSFRLHTKKKLPHYSRMGNPNISLETYASEPQIPNCQIKMVLGHRCNAIVPPEKLDVKLALERVGAPDFYFGFTDHWEESICLFHEWFGGSTQAFELANNRPTKRVNATISSRINDVDTVFIQGAMRIFEARLIKAGCISSGI